MAEAVGSPEKSDVKEKDDSPKARLRPPDKRKFENKLTSLIAQIKDKESTFKSLGRPSRPQDRDAKGEISAERETLLAELRRMKTERDKIIEERKTLDGELKTVNNQVQKKNDEHSKLKANLRYKTEEKIDEVIRRLEHQMRVQQLKLSEEKKLVQEINALKRSKLTFHETTTCLQSLNQLRDQQSDLRAKLNSCVKKINSIKGQEEEVKASLDKLRLKADMAWTLYREHNTERDALKKEIDDLYERKRQLVALFKKDQDAFYEGQREAREQARSMQAEIKKKEVSENLEIKTHVVTTTTRKHVSEPVFDIYSEEKGLCAALINYLERIHISSPQEDQVVEAAPVKDLSESFGDQNGYIKKKGDADLVGLFGGMQRKMSRKGSKKGRKTSVSQPRKLLHHPSVVEQFMALKLSLPQTASDVQQALNQLKELKIHYETALPAVEPELSRQDGIFGQNVGTVDVHVSTSLSEDGSVGENDSSLDPIEESTQGSECEIKEHLNVSLPATSDAPLVGEADQVSSDCTSKVNKTLSDNEDMAESSVETQLDKGREENLDQVGESEKSVVDLQSVRDTNHGVLTDNIGEGNLSIENNIKSDTEETKEEVTVESEERVCKLQSGNPKNNEVFVGNSGEETTENNNDAAMKEETENSQNQIDQDCGNEDPCPLVTKMNSSSTAGEIPNMAQSVHAEDGSLCAGSSKILENDSNYVHNELIIEDNEECVNEKKHHSEIKESDDTNLSPFDGVQPIKAYTHAPPESS